MRSTLTRSAARIEARDALTLAAFICAVIGAWLVTRSPRAVHASLVTLRIVVDYCLSTS
jgi:hypothetical protein